MMKSRITLIAVLSFIVVSTSSVLAQDKGSFALGGQLISPVGVSGKYALSEKSSITSVLGFFASDGYKEISFELNFIMYANSDKYNVGSGTLKPYWGGGLTLGANDFGSSDADFGLRVPFGIEYVLEDAPVEIYMDIGPAVGLSPNVDFGLDSSLGFRFYF